MTALIKAKFLFCVALTLSVAGCASDEPKIAAEFNQGASLHGELPENPLQWRVITSALNKGDSTTSTLYGNDVAVAYARSHSPRDYPSASVLSLVTWTQVGDARWFGAKIPALVKSAEFVTVSATASGQPSYSYEKYEGTPLRKAAAQDARVSSERVTYLLSQRAAVMP